MGSASVKQARKSSDPKAPSPQEMAELHKKSQKIDADIRKTQVEELRIMKILMLGSADSGKSTIVKQMKILHCHGFGEAEMTNSIFHMRENLITIYSIIAKMILDAHIVIPEEQAPLLNLFGSTPQDLRHLEEAEEMGKMREFKALPLVGEFLKNGLNSPLLPDNTEYVLARSSHIARADFKCTPEDIIHLRVTTSGVHEIMFEFKKYKIKMIDVGGQRTERRKWIHCFEGVSAVKFVTSLSGFDQVLEEDHLVNRMKDSVELFHTTLENEFLAKSSIILFLNKTDLLEKKLHTVKFSSFFKYDGPNEAHPVQQHLLAMFLKCNQDPNRKVYSHFTNATDTKNIDFVFAAACDIILRHSLNQAGMQ